MSLKQTPPTIGIAATSSTMSISKNTKPVNSETYFTEKKNRNEEAPLSLLNAGQILKGRIVEISKDYVVVDVGLKSEGLVPISEFTEPEELILGGEHRSLSRPAEGDDGQIVLSKEKARKFRQWEHIVNNCKEGSIVKGQSHPQSQRRPDGRHRHGSVPPRLSDRQQAN